MLNRLISLVFLLSFLKISIVYSETDFLLPQKKPSIFKKSEKQIQESINKNLPVPKPLLEKKGETKPAIAEQKKELAKKKEIKTELKKEIKSEMEIYCGGEVLKTNLFEEKIENKKYLTAYSNFGSYQNSDEFVVPDNHYFFLGDNRDCSKDSRFLTSVGYVHRDNIVGKARFIFFSTDKKIGRFIEFWMWNKSFRFDRFFKKIR